MLPQNQINGLDKILKEFCGVNHDLPIWGELQHSLWLHEEKILENRPLLFKRIFTWNNLLNVKNTIPIGDPFIYLDSYPKCTTDKAKILNVILPSAKLHALRQKVTPSNIYSELNHIEKIIGIAAKKFPGVQFQILLHPVLQNDDLLLSNIQKFGLEVLNPKSHVQRLQLLKTMNLLISDYPGAHFFRAITSNVQTELVNSSDLKIDFDSMNFAFKSIVIRILSSKINSVEKREKAKAVMGVEFKKSPEELASILGFKGKKLFAGSIVKKGYTWHTNRETSF